MAGLITAYTGVLLGRCWTITLEQQKRSVDAHLVRKPYPLIAEAAIGRWMA